MGATALAPAQAQVHSHSYQAAPVAQADEGGEGGEGGEGSTAKPNSVSSDVEYLSVLGQMQGHLIVAGELLALGRSQAAEPHAGHPVDELYSGIEKALTERKTPQFKAILVKLLDQVRLEPTSPDTRATLLQANQAIAQAIAAVPATVRNNPATIAAVARSLALTAASEYRAAVDGQQVVEVIEYQDSRGFMLVAKSLVQNSQDSSLKPMAKILNSMMLAWPSIEPPARTTLSNEQVQQLANDL
jgi:hypothetical protein